MCAHCFCSVFSVVFSLPTTVVISCKLGGTSRDRGTDIWLISILWIMDHVVYKSHFCYASTTITAWGPLVVSVPRRTHKLYFKLTKDDLQAQKNSPKGPTSISGGCIATMCMNVCSVAHSLTATCSHALTVDHLFSAHYEVLTIPVFILAWRWL